MIFHSPVNSSDGIGTIKENSTLTFHFTSFALQSSAELELKLKWNCPASTFGSSCKRLVWRVYSDFRTYSELFLQHRPLALRMRSSESGMSLWFWWGWCLFINLIQILYFKFVRGHHFFFFIPESLEARVNDCTSLWSAKLAQLK